MTRLALLTGSLFLVCCFPVLLKAQLNPTLFERFSTEQGLSDYTVMCLLQDSKGFLWIGTQSMLYQYNGHTFKAFQPAPLDSTRLSDGFIYTMEEDANGILWIGTRDGGLNRYDPGTEQFSRYQNRPDVSTSLSDDRVRAIEADPSGILWIGTQKGVLNAFDPATETFTRYQPSPTDTDDPGDHDIFAIYRALSEPDVLWIGRADGLYRFDRTTQRFTSFKHNPADATSLSHDTVYGIYEDASGTLWIGTRSGLDQLDRTTNTFRRHLQTSTRAGGLAHNGVLAILQGSDTRLWIGTNGGGLIRFDPSAGSFIRYTHEAGNPNSLSHDVVTALMVDQTGLLWVGTFVGINKHYLARDRSRFTHYGHTAGDANSLSHAEVIRLFEDRDGIVWIGTRGGGLNRLDRRTGAIRQYFNTPNAPLQTINAILQDRQGAFWLGAESNDLYQFDPTTQALKTVVLDSAAGISAIRSIYESRRRPWTLWIGTSHAGLYRYNLRTGAVQQFSYQPDDSTSLSHDDVWQTMEDRLGILWIATLGGGVNTFDPKTGTFVRYRHDSRDPFSLSSDKVVSIAEDKDGNLWFGTFDNGLNKYDRTTGRFSRYNDERSFPFQDVGGILIDHNGLLWMGTSNGLFTFDPHEEQVVRYHVSEERGLQGDIFYYRAYHKGAHGELYFGGNNGFNVFHPDSIDVERYVPPIVFTDFRVNDVALALDSSLTVLKEITLKHDQNFLYFEFAALDFRMPSKNQYRYMLVNEDNAWFNAGNTPSARYANLDPGRYVFQVQGANHRGTWNEEGASLRVIIAPPWWQTWWFYTLIGLAVLGLATAGYRYRVAKLLEMEHMRIRIASDLHDDLGGKLSGIALMTDLVQRRAMFDETAQRRLAQVSDTARHMVDELRDIVWFITPEYDKLDDTLTKMQNVTEMMLGEIHYTFQYPEDAKGEVLAMEFRRHFLLCYKEILHNVVRHARAANVEIRLGRERGRLLLTVVDDGVGFDVEAAREGNGLKNLRQRAALMNGTLDITSRPGGGTTVRLTAKTT